MSESVRWVVGLDLSLTATGFAGVSLDGGDIFTSVFRSKGTQTDDLDTRYNRLISLATQIVNSVLKLSPRLVAIEGPAPSRIVGHQHDRSGLWWLVSHSLMGRGVPMVEVGPTVRAKYGTGNGKAGKDEVVIAVTRRYPSVEFKVNDEADALILAMIAARLLGCPQDRPPKTHLEAMKSLALPEGVKALA